jgi:serine/threonine protein kinase/tetratricopeptide (TPR) repeat protein
MYVREPASLPVEADSVRAHLEECERCRATAATLENDDNVQITLADRYPESTRPLPRVRNVDEPADGGAAATIEMRVGSPPSTDNGERALALGQTMYTQPPDDVAAAPRKTEDNRNAAEFGQTMYYQPPADIAAAPLKTEDSASVLDSRQAIERLPLSEAGAPREAGERSQASAHAETMHDRPQPEAGPSDAEFELSDPDTETKRGGTSHSAHTRELRPGAGSGQGAASSASALPIVPRSREGSFKVPAGLENASMPGYDILAELGRGGMGVVYKARDRRLQRLVALKMVLAGAHAGAVGLARFRAEAEAAAKLTHANIVQIYETGEHEGRPFFSLEFVDGGSLEQRLAGNPTNPRAAAELIETLARAMQVAHERGIVHRDLKPANILLARLSSQSSIVRTRGSDSQSLPPDHWSRATTPKIADFGLAKHLDDDSSQTKSGTILGTPSYMAPEQAEGRSRDVGPAADIYALGAILYELLVGRPPFRAGNPIDTIRQVVEQEPVPPRQLEPRVPLDLQTICLKCLEKMPTRRFATAGALADDLRRFIDGDPIQARPTPGWERAWKWAKRRPAAVALLAVSTLAVVAMVLFIAWHNISLRGKLDTAINQERRARQREMDALAQHRLALVQQEAQKLYDSARVAVAARDWTAARLDLEKALLTIGGESALQTVKAPAEELLDHVKKELSVEAARRASGQRHASYVKLRDQAQFLGTLYTGMDLAANLQAARASVEAALGVYGVVAGREGPPELDPYLSAPERASVLEDCAALLLIFAETQAQSSSSAGQAEREQFLQKALLGLDQAQRLGAPRRACELRRARYLRLLGHETEAKKAELAAAKTALSNVVDHFLMADELYRREQFAEAIHEFDHVLAQKPGHFWAQYLGALCLLRQQRPAEARALLSACMAQRSDFVWLYLVRGFAQEELQAWPEADADFEKAAAIASDDNARYVLAVNRGVLRIRTGRIDDAIRDLSTAIKLKPEAYQAFVNLAQAYRASGKLAQALEPLNRAIELQPGLAHLYRLRAHLHMERREPDLALKDFDRAIDREDSASPHQLDDAIERGRLLLGSGKYAAALASFDKAAAQKSDDALAQRLRAEALFRLGRFEEAIEAFDRYFKTGQPLESVYRGRGLARAELGQFPGAIDDFTKALELHPTSAVQAFRGWTHLVVDAPKLALRDFELAIELDPKNGDAYSGRGLARIRLGRHREALLDAAEALRQGPSSPRLSYNSARIYAQGPRPDSRRALELVHQALSMLPAEERRTFWSAHIQKDPAFTALRRLPLFIELETELSRGHLIDAGATAR